MQPARHNRLMDLSDVIRTKRQAAKLSQRKLAAAIGVSPGAVAQWEGGLTRPTFENMQSLADVIGLPLAGPVSPGSPYRGELVEDPDELALLGFWRKLTPDQRRMMTGMLRGVGLQLDAA